MKSANLDWRQLGKPDCMRSAGFFRKPWILDFSGTIFDLLRSLLEVEVSYCRAHKNNWPYWLQKNSNYFMSRQIVGDKHCIFLWKSDWLAGSSRKALLASMPAMSLSMLECKTCSSFPFYCCCFFYFLLLLLLLQLVLLVLPWVSPSSSAYFCHWKSLAHGVQIKQHLSVQINISTFPLLYPSHFCSNFSSERLCTHYHKNSWPIISSIVLKIYT